MQNIHNRTPGPFPDPWAPVICTAFPSVSSALRTCCQWTLNVFFETPETHRGNVVFQNTGILEYSVVRNAKFACRKFFLTENCRFNNDKSNKLR
jgi:hypothetical protein